MLTCRESSNSLNRLLSLLKINLSINFINIFHFMIFGRKIQWVQPFQFGYVLVPPTFWLQTKIYQENIYWRVQKYLSAQIPVRGGLGRGLICSPWNISISHVLRYFWWWVYTHISVKPMLTCRESSNSLNRLLSLLKINLSINFINIFHFMMFSRKINGYNFSN